MINNMNCFHITSIINNRHVEISRLEIKLIYYYGKIEIYLV